MADPRLIPSSLAADPSAEAWNEMAERLGTLDASLVLVYLVDNAPPAALPVLAEQFRVTSLEWRLARNDQVRRLLIKAATRRRSHLGTPGAIEEGLEILGLNGVVQEWFEYGGEPGHFRVVINLVADIDEETQTLLEQMIVQWKRRSAWLDSIDYVQTVIGNVPAYAFAATSAGVTSVLATLDQPDYVPPPLVDDDGVTPVVDDDNTTPVTG